MPPMLGTAEDVKLASKVESELKATMVPMVRRFHLVGWVDEGDLTARQLWNTVKTADQDERSGISLPVGIETYSSLVLDSLDFLWGELLTSDPYLERSIRSEVEREAKEFMAQLRWAASRNTVPRTRYHERKMYALLYILPVIMVYLALHGLAPPWAQLDLVASLTLALLGLYIRYYTKALFWERIGGGGFRAYPGP
jgi:hypothetical protein